MQTIKKEQSIQGCLKSTPKHESYIAKIFNYNASKKTRIQQYPLPEEKLQCNQVFVKQLFLITKSLQSVKLQESPVPKKCNIVPRQTIEETKKKKTHKVMFKTEIDENNQNPIGFATQRKSYDCVFVEQKIKNSNLRTRIFELESKNLEQNINLQEKNARILQLQEQIERSKQKQKLLLKEQQKEEKAFLEQYFELSSQGLNDKRIMRVLTQLHPVGEWKKRFLLLNKQFHEQQEVLFRMEAEQQSSYRKRAEALNYFNQ